jgi:hypothetical protein
VLGSFFGFTWFYRPNLGLALVLPGGDSHSPTGGEKGAAFFGRNGQT